MARDLFECLVFEGRVGERQRPAPFEQVGGEVIAVRSAIGRDGTVVVLIARFAADETLDLEIERERRAAATLYRALEAAAGLRRRRNVDAIQPVRAPLDAQRSIVVHKCVARHLRERWAGQQQTSGGKYVQ